MPRMTILRGISGSGKSTWAESWAGSPAIVSRDRIRMSLFGTESFIDEDLVTAVEDATIAAALKSGRDVIVDDTNIHMKYVNRLAHIGYRLGADVELKVFDVELGTAYLMNDHRASQGGRNVPHDVIKRQHGNLRKSINARLPERPSVRPYEGTPGKPEAFLVDIDGTLAHMGDKRGPYDWNNVHLDDVDQVISDIVRVLGSTNFAMDLGHYKVIVMSGRDESCREITEKWLDDNGVLFDELFMRPAGDMRKDNIIKAELFDAHVRDNYDVKFVLDDRQQVVDMWRQMGITCLQVAPGEF